MTRTPLPDPPENLAFCFMWMQDVAELLHLRVLPFRLQPIALEDAIFLSDDGRIPVPHDLALYYAHCTPWPQALANPWDVWRSTASGMRALTGEEAYLLPVLLVNDNGVVAVIEDETHYQLAEFREGRLCLLDEDLREYLIRRVLGES